MQPTFLNRPNSLLSSAKQNWICFLWLYKKNWRNSHRRNQARSIVVAHWERFNKHKDVEEEAYLTVKVTCSKGAYHQQHTTLEWRIPCRLMRTESHSLMKGVRARMAHKKEKPRKREEEEGEARRRSQKRLSLMQTAPPLHPSRGSIKPSSRQRCARTG